MTAYTQRVKTGSYYTDGRDVWEVVGVCELGAVELLSQNDELRSMGIDAFRRAMWLVCSKPATSTCGP